MDYEIDLGQAAIDQTAGGMVVGLREIDLSPRAKKIGKLLAEWKSINWDACTLTVVAETPRGGGRGRCRSCRNWSPTCGRGGLQTPMTTRVLPFTGDVRRLYDDWHRFAGKDRVPKNARSSTGTALIGAGVPTAVVKEPPGHRIIAITQRYYVNPVNMLRAAAEARFMAK